MIIDLILDRKDGVKYDAATFYRDAMRYGEVGFGITEAMDYGTENDVKIALVQYLIDNEYNMDIATFILKNKWL